MERATNQGVDLVGGLTENVLEASLEAEMSEHLGTERTRSGRLEHEATPKRHPFEEFVDRYGAGGDRCLVIATGPPWLGAPAGHPCQTQRVRFRRRSAERLIT